MARIERIGLKIIEKEFIESTFKVMSYLAISAATLTLVKFSVENAKLLEATFLLMIFIILASQTFFYSFRNVSIPLCEAIWEKVNYAKDLKYLANKQRKRRLEMMKSLMFSRPALFAVTFYVLSIWGITSTLDVLVQRSLA